MRTRVQLKSQRSRPKQAGFTLLEVILAVGLLSVVSVSLFVTMSRSFRVKDNMSVLSERYHEGRQVMRRITREIRMAFLKAQPPEEVQEEGPAVITRFLGEEDEIYFANKVIVV